MMDTAAPGRFVADCFVGHTLFEDFCLPFSSNDVCTDGVQIYRPREINLVSVWEQPWQPRRGNGSAHTYVDRQADIPPGMTALQKDLHPKIVGCE